MNVKQNSGEGRFGTDRGWNLLLVYCYVLCRENEINRFLLAMLIDLKANLQSAALFVIFFKTFIVIISPI